MNTQGHAGRRLREFTGRHLALMIVAFFAVVIAANLILAVLANRTWTGLIVANGYVASQEYNGLLAAARAQDARGWTSEIARRGSGLELRIADSRGAPIDGLEVRMAIGRPTHENEDRELVFEQRFGGLYSAGADLKAGEWNAELRAYDGTGLVYRRDIRLRIAEPAAPRP